MSAKVHGVAGEIGFLRFFGAGYESCSDAASDGNS